MSDSWEGTHVPRWKLEEIRSSLDRMAEASPSSSLPTPFVGGAKDTAMTVYARNDGQLYDWLRTTLSRSALSNRVKPSSRVVSIEEVESDEELDGCEVVRHPQVIHGGSDDHHDVGEVEEEGSGRTPECGGANDMEVEWL